MTSAKKVVNIKTSEENDVNTENVMSSDDSSCILELSASDAKSFFLKNDSYCNFDLPPYFDFTAVLNDVDAILANKKLSDFQTESPRNYNDLNYKILSNKDGRYAWRPIQLIHPAIYVSLVHRITEDEHWKTICERFEEINTNSKIQCVSLPRQSNTKQKDKAEQIKHWIDAVEQQSLVLSLDYNHLIHTDITDCYSSIYTHAIAWAIHGKSFVKQKENKNNKALIGNIIDCHMQDMSHGQTNGIAQGSVLMDFVAEIVLAYVDHELTNKISDNIDYRIIRYRDDYRIFTNNPRDAEYVVKSLTEVLSEIGLKLNAQKTIPTTDLIQGSIKDDKLYWIKEKRISSNIQKQILLIHDLAQKFPNSGSLIKALEEFHTTLLKKKSYKKNVVPVISIVVDIAVRNPRTYPIIAAILSSLFQWIDAENQKLILIDKIKNKLSHIPNTGHLEIWMQRVTNGFDNPPEYTESLCLLAQGSDANIWNVEWMNDALKKAMDPTKIIDSQTMNDLPIVIPKQEIELFKIHSL